MRENLGVPLEGDRDVGALCGSHQGCQVPFRPPIPNVGLLLQPQLFPSPKSKPFLFSKGQINYVWKSMSLHCRLYYKLQSCIMQWDVFNNLKSRVEKLNLENYNEAKGIQNDFHEVSRLA